MSGFALGADDGRIAGSGLAGRGWVGNVMVESLGWFGGTDFRLSPNRLHCAYMLRRAEPGSREYPARQVFLDGRAGPEFDWVREFVFSPDGSHLSYVDSVGRKYSVVADGQIGPKYDGIPLWPVFSPDGNRTAYTARTGERWCVVVDGRAGPTFDSVGLASLSPNGKRVAYPAMQNKKWHMVVDDSIGPSFRKIEGSAFSSDGDHFAYSGWTGDSWRGPLEVSDKRREIRRVVVDGRPGPDLLGVSKVYSALGGKHWLYEGHTAERRVVVVDGRIQPSYGDILCFIADTLSGRYVSLVRDGNEYLALVDSQPGPRFKWAAGPVISYGGRHVAYEAEAGDGFHMVLDDQPGPAYDSIRWPMFSPDGDHFAYFAEEDSEWFVVKDGVAGPNWNKVFVSRSAEPECSMPWASRRAQYDPLFSTSGGHVAYVGTRGYEDYPVFDSSVGRSYDVIRSLTFSPDGRRTAYAARDSGWSVIVDGKPTRILGSVACIQFSPNSRHVLYLVWPGRDYSRRAVVLDSMRGPETGEIGRFWFSPTGEHVAYSFKDGGRSHVTVDLKPGPDFDQVWDPVFDSDDAIEYLAATGSTLYRVHCRL